MHAVVVLIVCLLFLAVVSIIILAQVKEHHSKDDPMLHELLTRIKPVFKADRYYAGPLEPLNDRDILEEIDLYRSKNSYTINKQKIYLCLRDENGEYYNINTLTYVLLHEMAHVICDEVGHTKKFHDIFEAILAIAKEKGIYDPSIPIVYDYCMDEK